MTTLKERIGKRFGAGYYEDLAIAFYRQELLALAEQMENMKQPEIVKYNNGLAVAAALIRNRANELV